MSTPVKTRYQGFEVMIPILGGCSRCHNNYKGTEVYRERHSSKGVVSGSWAGARATPEDRRKSVWGAYRSIYKEFTT